MTNQCANLPSEGLLVEEFITDDTHKTVWVIHVPKHMRRRPVYAHSKAWQRLDDSLVGLEQSRLEAILDEQELPYDWSAQVIEEATIDDLDADAIQLARDVTNSVIRSLQQNVTLGLTRHFWTRPALQ